jgi:hypothetical protein
MNSPKLRGIKPVSDEAFYLLAAYCFNLSRKLEYFFLATKEFAPQADREVVERLARDREELSRAGSDWQAIAEKEEELMRRIYGEIQSDYDAVWNRLTSSTER